MASLGGGGKDGRGRATMALDDALRLTKDATGITFSAEDARMLLQADAGNAEAQADIGALLYVGNAHDAALHWLHQAAEQGNAEAMQWLGAAYAHINPADTSLAISWISKAAANGHSIAQAQMDGLFGTTFQSGA